MNNNLINNLMIGDWVSVNGLPAQVAELAYKDNELTIGVYDSKGEIYTCYCGLDSVEPIPLTAAILEKNGFLKQSDDYMRYFKAYDENYYFGFESISYFFDTKIAKITKEDKQSGLQERVEFVCQYVHELQHALKLCNIDKTIEL